jgi:hypothetical protein
VFASAAVRCKNNNNFGENWHDIVHTTSRRNAGGLAQPAQPGARRVLDTVDFRTRNQRSSIEWRRDLGIPSRGLVTRGLLIGVRVSFAGRVGVCGGFARGRVSFTRLINVLVGCRRGTANGLAHQSRRPR